MDATFLTGTYTYRGFFDLPEPVAEFGTLRFAQLELRLTADPDGDNTGFLVFFTQPGGGLKGGFRKADRRQSLSCICACTASASHVSMPGPYPSAGGQLGDWVRLGRRITEEGVRTLPCSGAGRFRRRGGGRSAGRCRRRRSPARGE